MDCRTAADALAGFYESLTPASLTALERFYAPDARFKDPFNDVTGAEAIAALFRHMFATVDTPRFVVGTRIVQGSEAMLGWDFHLRVRGRPVVIQGVTQLRFDTDGRVTLHRDYWDAAGELYVHLPLIGRLMRWLQARLGSR
jgi:ketosteroid isomerase-like protein